MTTLNRWLTAYEMVLDEVRKAPLPLDRDGNPVDYRELRAPKGGTVLQGVAYPGGRWIPNADLEKAREADPHAVEALEQGQNLHPLQSVQPPSAGAGGGGNGVPVAAPADPKNINDPVTRQNIQKMREGFGVSANCIPEWLLKQQRPFIEGLTPDEKLDLYSNHNGHVAQMGFAHLPKLEQIVTVWKGIKFSSPGQQNVFLQKCAAALDTEEELHLTGHNLTTLNSDLLGDFSKDGEVVLEIVVRKGILIALMAEESTLAEFLLPPNGRFRVLELDKHGVFKIIKSAQAQRFVVILEQVVEEEVMVDAPLLPNPQKVGASV